MLYTPCAQTRGCTAKPFAKRRVASRNDWRGRSAGGLAHPTSLKHYGFEYLSLEEAEVMKRTTLTPIYSMRGTGGQSGLMRYGTWLIVLPFALLLFYLLPSDTIAETTTSTIEGVVTDAKSALVVGAEVKVSGTTLASERGATTD